VTHIGSVALCWAELEALARDVEAGAVTAAQVEAGLWLVNHFLQGYERVALDLRRECWNVRRRHWEKNRPPAKFGPRAKGAGAGGTGPVQPPATTEGD
jgi:hypothetical protein